MAMEPTEFIDAVRSLRKEIIQLCRETDSDWMNEEARNKLYLLYTTSFDLEYGLRESLRDALCRDFLASSDS